LSTGTGLLRPGLLAGARLALTQFGEAGPASACRGELERLGALVTETPEAGSEALIVDAAAAHGESLAPTLSETWSAVHGYAGSLIEATRPGRIVLIAPPDEAASAALENLARTLSVEWARRSITVVAIARAEATSAADVAALVAYLCSPAGEYFSGCLLDMRSGSPPG